MNPNNQIEIKLNGESKFVQQGLRVSQLLSDLGINGRPVAVEINHQIAVRDEHESLVIGSGDVIEIVSLVGGG